MVVSLFSYWMKHIFLFSDFCKKNKINKSLYASCFAISTVPFIKSLNV